MLEEEASSSPMSGVHACDTSVSCFVPHSFFSGRVVCWRRVSEGAPLPRLDVVPILLSLLCMYPIKEGAHTHAQRADDGHLCSLGEPPLASKWDGRRKTRTVQNKKRGNTVTRSMTPPPPRPTPDPPRRFVIVCMMVR